MPPSKNPPTRPAAPAFEHAGFFALRTPLLPFDELREWSEGLAAPHARGDDAALDDAVAADRAALRARLRTAYARPDVREALFLASPVLSDAVDPWLRGEPVKDADKLERALARYYQRMAGRATPFGLFAGCSVGTVGAATRLPLAPRARCARHTRLDSDYLHALAAALDQDPALRGERLAPNSSLYRVGDRLRYIESRQRGRARAYRLVAAEATDYLAATLEHAGAAGAGAGALAAALVAGDARGEVSDDDARAFVDELVATQVLVTPHAPIVTGPEPVHDAIARLRASPAPSAPPLAAALTRARDALAALDARGVGVEPARYREVAEGLAALPPRVDLPTLFQVDMTRPAPDAQLGVDVIDELRRGAELLQQVSGLSADDPLESFRERFVARFGDREVPLVLALDEESGVGFDASGGAVRAEASPLLAGLALPGPARGERAAPVGERHRVLLEKVLAASAQGAREITLSDDDIARIASPAAPPLPDAFSVMGAVAADSPEALARGAYRVAVHGVSGPSGATLLGRFCHADPALRAHVERHLRAEEALAPEAVFAEVVHLPEGRVGNILLRPVLRPYEIPYLGRSGAPADRQIAVTDLRVSVRDGRVTLRSERLGRAVIPRLTTAHNFGSPRSLGLYRFLCTLQAQGVAGGLMWSWGALDSAPFLPRVAAGRLVLASARWTLREPDLAPLLARRGGALFRAAQALRARRGLPRHALLVAGDNGMPVDFDNALSVEAFAHLARDRARVTLEEMFPGPDALLARGPEGAFVHELVVPFVRARSSAATGDPPRAAAVEPARDAPAARAASFAPGSEWLYAKLYTGSATADRVLRELVAPLVARARAEGAADGWFYLRYGDPEWHLRVRLHGSPGALLARVVPALHAAAEPWLRAGVIARVQLDTYEPETERYGGPEGLALAERLFEADSDAALGVVSAVAGDEAQELRWQLALRGVDALLDDLGLDLAGKRDLARAMRASFAAEFRAGPPTDRQLGERYRAARGALDALFAEPAPPRGALAHGLAALRRRSRALAPVADALRAAASARRLTAPLPELAQSYAHMHVNRVLRGNHRAQEFVLYDLLARLYESRAARAARG